MYRPINTKKNSDRFIPHRLEINIDLFAQDLTSSSNPEKLKDVEFVNYAKIRHTHRNYQNALRNVLLPLDTRILNFFSPKKFTPTDFSIRTDEKWPVKPRKRPVIGPPEIILDMPQFDSNICYHVADWSSLNCLATIFENEIHMWYPNIEFLRATTNTQRRVQHCVKWRKEGSRFAVGLFPNRVGIWDICEKKLISEIACCVPFCKVYCLEWLSDNFLVTGCSKGALKINTWNLKECLKKVFLTNSIINIASSCNKKFIATSTMDKNVTIWKVPELEIHLQLCNMPSIVRALAWHPWKNSLLAIGVGYSEATRILLYNVNTKKIIARGKYIKNTSSMDCMTFNPISGELVVSLFNHSEKDPCGMVVVLSNIDTNVEELHIHNGPIPYLLWGMGGKILASASADENLCIWDFFGTLGKKKEEPKSRKLGRGSENSKILRTCIR